MKNYFKIFGIFIWAMIAIAASAGAINTMIGFYIVVGILNATINGTCIYFVCKHYNLF